jgi:hypothetical protein
MRSNFSLLGNDAIPHTGTECPQSQQGLVNSYSRMFDLNLAAALCEFAQGTWDVKSHAGITVSS